MNPTNGSRLALVIVALFCSGFPSAIRVTAAAAAAAATAAFHRSLQNHNPRESPLRSDYYQQQHHTVHQQRNPTTTSLWLRKKVALFSSQNNQNNNEEEPSSKAARTAKENNNEDNKTKKQQPKRKELKTYSARFLEDNGIRIAADEQGRVTAKLAPISRPQQDTDNSTVLQNNDKDMEKNGKETQQQQPSSENSSIIDSNNNNDDEEEEEGLQKQQKHTPTTSDQEEEEPSKTITTPAAATADHEYDMDIDEKLKDFPLPPVHATSSNATEQEKPKLFFKKPNPKQSLKEQPAKVVPRSGFNVVLTHCTADFDSLASAVGLAKLWASSHDPALQPEGNDEDEDENENEDGTVKKKKKDYDSSSDVPTFVVLPRGAHPGVQRFLSLHKHLFPIRSLKSLPDDLTGLNRLGLVDAQRRDRIGPAENLLQYAKRVTVVDHHIDSDTDIPEATDYVVDQVGSVSTLIAERLQQADLELTEAEATLLALGIHADTGSLCYDSTTPRDAMALAWVMSQGASQAAIAEHAQSSLSPEQQGVLTQALINTNSTVIHGVTLSTCLLTADGFINGLAAVTQDALELSSSDIYLLAVVYEAQSGGKRKSKGNARKNGGRLTSRLLAKYKEHFSSRSLQYDEENGFNAHTSKSTHNNTAKAASAHPVQHNYTKEEMAQAQTKFADAWRGGEEASRKRRLQAAFERNDLDASGYLEEHEIAATLAASGIIASPESIRELMQAIDTDGDGKVNFEEFVNFAVEEENRQLEEDIQNGRHRASTMIIIGRVKAGVNMKSVKLNRLLEKYGGGGHAKAASATVRLNDESEAEEVLQGLVDEVVRTSLQEQPLVGDFMTAPVLSVKPDMTEKQVEDYFTRYDVRALPVVDEDNEVIGLVTYKEVAAAKQRLFNKEQKRLRREKEADEKGVKIPYDERKAKERQKNNGSTVKGWMLQHVRVVEDTMTIAEVEAILLETDVGCIPVVAEGTMKLIGMLTRTDLLRQHRYYPSLHYHNKGFADSIASRKPIIELRKRLKRFDLENE